MLILGDRLAHHRGCGPSHHPPILFALAIVVIVLFFTSG